MDFHLYDTCYKLAESVCNGVCELVNPLKPIFGSVLNLSCGIEPYTRRTTAGVPNAS